MHCSMCMPGDDGYIVEWVNMGICVSWVYMYHGYISWVYVSWIYVSWIHVSWVYIIGILYTS